MKAIIREKAGKEFSTMKVMEIPSPEVKEGELKVKMLSSRINPVDMDLMKGFPALKYKTPQPGGVDGAGVVIETGKGVSGFKAGDTVFFYRLFSDIGTWAEEITIPASYCALVPESIDKKEAGSIALPLLTAYDSIQQLKPKNGESILIHGVAGGVGFQALQVAKRFGLKVIGTANESAGKELEKAGLDRLIDYTKEDFSLLLKSGDVNYVFDTLGGEVLKKSIALQPQKIVSLKYVDPAQMPKAGVNLPGILKWIMKLMMYPYRSLASKHNVILIGQVTGADGPLLQKAVDLIRENFISRPFKIKTLTEIEKHGLSAGDIGKVILFQ